MGFYFRKSKSFGPFRLNLSKSGIGISAGVKGARLSVGPRGTYINVGKNGIYYRQKLGGASGKSNRKPAKNASVPVHSLEDNQVSTDLIYVSTNEGTEFELGKTIIQGIKRAALLTWVLVITAFFLTGITHMWSVPVALIIPLLFPQIFKASITYNLDNESSEKWKDLLAGFNSLKSCRKTWIIETANLNSDTKYHAGAQRNVSRRDISVKIVQPLRSPGQFLKTNVPCIVLKSKKCSIIFLPNCVFVKKGRKRAAYSYEKLEIVASTTDFIEYGNISKDSKIVRYTWQYVNKDGSADMRFSKNRRFPVCRYGRMQILAENALSIELHCSNYDSVKVLEQAYHTYQSYVCTLKVPNSSTTDRNTDVKNPEQSDHTQSIIDQLNKIAVETGHDMVENFATWLDCKVTFLDGQYYDNHTVLYYCASKDISETIPALEKELNQKLDCTIRLNLTAKDAFIVHLFVGENFDFGDYKISLSPILEGAYQAASQWSSNCRAGKEDIYSSLFETDSGENPTSNDDALTDEILMFLKEE